ncbi:nitrogen fixation protein NifQ [Salipiger sp. P9]|uniref:nitrogen fixation protein NifQ n=1 Tax=Salipiger pentaromativorans TaxID=2943193 RepID=UPI0021571072|nr:nitrogen fixation protein NifQ [Salipiger pentaromativorans]MCR8547457.1 nitrogen fixation protein NifQ [Salipiger pentaromativorans]
MRPSTDIAAAADGRVTDAMVTVSDFSCILDHALHEREAGAGPLTERLGLSGAEIAALRDRWLPRAALPDLDLGAPALPDDQRAIFTLILWRGGSASREARWLAAILARRAMETRHLWEDLGLPSRAALSALIARHLPGLAAANSQNMRWKKFFYRQICSDAAFSLCLSPSCDDCEERAECFAPD